MRMIHTFLAENVVAYTIPNSKSFEMTYASNCKQMHVSGRIDSL